ncbi:unnamed protein product [Medioppia subpectinata]|uniref:G-protein coupled receptors family 1 profile domain-containing protein n=1 Tax=Medioppia subpectinata TaxID=1979941 RepID=A0A7R9L6A6_9ACAR|nr:unnamed protein product [Medioppia subpectinata]CAG2116183.1 unnamed protein product [Medioppia subpectinata]
MKLTATGGGGTGGGTGTANGNGIDRDMTSGKTPGLTAPAVVTGPPLVAMEDSSYTPTCGGYVGSNPGNHNHKHAHRASVTCVGQICTVRNLSLLRRRTKFKEDRERRVAKTLLIITSVFLVCWSPFFLTFSVYIGAPEMPFHLQQTLIWFGLCNSTINPFIYAYFVPTFRQTFRKILCRK